MKVKKLLLMGMISVIALTSACGKTETKEPVEAGKIEVVEKDTLKATEAVTEKPIETEEESLLPGVFKVPGYSIYVDVPDLHSIESGFTQVYYEDQVKYVTFSCIQLERAQDAKEAFDKVYKPFVNSMSGFDTINQLSEVNGEIIEVNGIAVYSFEGKLNCGLDPVYEAYMKGYSFVYQDMPCAIIGVVKDNTQPQEQIDVVKELVDAMILTVRSEK